MCSSRRLPDDVLPDGNVERCGERAHLVQACAVPHGTTSTSGRIRLTTRQLRAFRRLVTTKSRFDSRPSTTDVTAVDLDERWILPHDHVAEQVMFVRVALDEFWFEKRDRSGICQLTADQAQSLVEYSAEIDVALRR